MKRIIAVMLAVVLVVGGLGGFVYAQDNSHEPMTGQKLVGSGVFAEWTYPDGPNAKMGTGFLITNHDCVSEITIDRIFVFAFDGTVVYEGPLRVKIDHAWEEHTGLVKPHETLQTSLEYYDLPEITGELEMIYTVEIFWRWTNKEGLPLTGWAWTSQVKRDVDTEEAVDIAMNDMTQMVNMEQVLKKAK